LALALDAAEERAAQQPSIGCCWTTAWGGGGGGVALWLVIGAASAVVVGKAALAAPEGTGTAWGSAFFLHAASASPQESRRVKERRGRIMMTLLPAFRARRQIPAGSCRYPSATTHAVAAVQALVAGAVAHGDVPAAIADRRVAHHVLELRVEGAGAPLALLL